MTEKKFRFSLDSVLELRERATKQALQKLARVMQDRKEQERRLKQAKADVQRLAERFEQPRRYSSPSLRRSDAHRKAAQQAVTRHRRRLENLKKKEETARRTLEEAHQAEEALKVLYKEEKAKHKKAVQKAEINFFDEQAVTRHHRNQQNGSG